MKKRTVLLFISLLMLLQAPFIFAADEQVVYGKVSTEETLASGNTFTYEVGIRGNQGIITGAVAIDWSADSLQLVSWQIGSVMPDNGTAPVKDGISSFVVVLGNDTAPDNFTKDGVLFTLTFKVLESASSGAQQIQLRFGRDETDFLNFDLAVVPTRFESGSVTLQGHVHNLEKTDAVDSTENNPGNHAYWTCSVCGQYFADEEGVTEIAADSWVIPPIGPVVDPQPEEPADPNPQGDSSKPSTPSGPSDPTPAEQSKRTEFTDVSGSDYFSGPVAWAVEKGITNGISKNRFGPHMDCSRGQVVTFLWIANGSKIAKTETAFRDVAASAYYAKSVAWAVENGITAGTSAAEFSPDKTVTRAQFITMLWISKGMPVTSGQPAFDDVSETSYYAKAVAWAFENGITAGKSVRRFGSGDPCTRGQIVTFLYNAEHL